MQGWVVAGVWLFAVVFAVVVLGYATYELAWKRRRVLTDRANLNGVVTELTTVTADLQRAADRAKAVSSTLRRAGPSEPFVS